MEAVALDTNIIIAGFSGDETILSSLDNVELVYIPVTVAGELCFGAFKSDRVTDNLKRVHDFVSEFELIEIGFDVSDKYGVLKSTLQRAGTPAADNDMWIAACAIHKDVPIVTRDSHFDLIGDVQQLRW